MSSSSSLSRGSVVCLRLTGIALDEAAGGCETGPCNYKSINGINQEGSQGQHSASAEVKRWEDTSK